LYVPSQQSERIVTIASVRGMGFVEVF
jgi:hypothetical protein